MICAATPFHFQFSQLLRSESSDLSEEEREQYLEKILRSGSIHGHLDQWHSPNQRLSLAPTPREKIALDEILDECLFLLEAEIREKKRRSTSIDRFRLSTETASCSCRFFPTCSPMRSSLFPMRNVPKCTFIPSQRRHLRDSRAGQWNWNSRKISRNDFQCV